MPLTLIARGVRTRLVATAVVAFAPALPAAAQEGANIAAQLANPVANLINVPLQNNWDLGGGRGDALRYTLNIQPVIPIALNQDWNLITRTILPVSHFERVYPDHRTGLGDVVQSFFLSPQQPVAGITWGAGPVLLYPTGTDGLGQRQWGGGPTGVVLRQQGDWLYGALANHIWSFGGTPDRSEAVNSTFLNPFVSYLLPGGRTLTLQAEATYDWSRTQWTVPVSALAGQVVTIGGQTVQFNLGARYFAEKPEGGPNWGIRFVVNFVFPR